MSVNGIGSQSFYETIIGQKSNKKDSGNDFYNSLSDTIGEKAEVKSEAKAGCGEAKKADCSTAAKSSCCGGAKKAEGGK